MMNMPSVLSIVFSAACAVCIFTGIYILYLNPRNRSNMLFFALTVALGIWAFGFCIAISANDISTALFWRRFSAVGWGAFFSILLRFSLVFTGNEIFVRKKWRCAALYLPSIAVFLGFTYFPELNPGQYDMVWTNLGWVNVAVNNTWDMFYLVYYVFYSLATLYLIWRWGKNSVTPQDSKQSRLILISFTITFLISSFVDTFGNMIFSVKIPQLTPLFMMLPVLVIYNLIKKYGLFNPRHVDSDSTLMSSQIRTKMTNYLSNAFLFASILNVIATYVLFQNADLMSTLLFSGFLVFVGVVLQAIQRSVKKESRKDLLNAAVFSLTIPILTFRFIEYASVTIWAFPFILLVITLVYGESFIQIILFVTILLTQIVVWIVKPETSLTIDGADHIVRLGMFLIAIWFVNFSRNIYRSKLQENTEQINGQQIIMEVSNDFITANEQNIDEKINHALSKIGTFLKLNRSYLYLFDQEKKYVTCRNVWFDPKVTDKKFDAHIRCDSFPLFMSQIKAGNTIVRSDLADVSCETGGELPHMLDGFDKSFAAVPVLVKNDNIGFLGFEANRKNKKWPEPQVAFLRILSTIFGDALERIHQDNEILKMAFYDYLTKLPNRTLFKDRVTQAIHLAERTNKIIAVVFLDMDAFKSVNDTIGHDGGDDLIVKAAERLIKRIRNSDTLSRFGGDEFLILLNNLNSTDNVLNIVEKILGIFETPFVINGQEFYITASAGIAVYPYDGRSSDELIKNADIAMYKAKELGKNRYKLCTEDMKKETLFKTTLAGNLYRALEKNELQLYYQPKVNTQSKKVMGVEALLRWFHPGHGVIPPDVFIPLAEQSGLIGPIGDWVLMTACRQCRTWHLNGLPDIRIAVNVSVMQLRNPEFARRVEEILEEQQLEPRYLELEVTESAVVREPQYIVEKLDQLKQLGVSISIDDFGTEYSSLSRLCEMPIDRVKLDIQFVRSIGVNEKTDSIIRGIIRLAHTLGLEVIAEGVETEQQLKYLAECNSDEIQGFFFYHPLPPQELEETLKKRE